MTGGGADGPKDRFFVSYVSADVRWAEWVAWMLEASGHSVLVQAWDFGPGSHVVKELHAAVSGGRRTLVLLSAAYLASSYTAEEWQAVWASDPAGSRKLLLVVRIEDCDLPGLLRQLVSVDLFGVVQETARARLLAAVEGRRAKPAEEPEFPSGKGTVSVSANVRTIGGAAAGLAPVFPSDLPAVWNMPPRLARFVGRVDLLDRLHGELAGHTPASVGVIQGLGGVGKTSLALEYAHRHADEFDVVWWLSAYEPSLLSEQVAALGAALGLPPGGTWPSVAAALRQQHRRWLVVLDNVGDPEVIGPFRPSDPRGRLLVTSRLVGLDGLGAVVAVAEFDRAEAASLLAARLPGIDTQVAERIAALLGDLPLAVEQAAGYLTRTAVPPADYAMLLQNRLADMLHRGHVAERPGVTVANVWALTMARARAERPAAAELLDLCAYLDPEQIPLDLIINGADYLPAGPLRQATKDPLEWADTIGTLLGFSLVRREGQTITIHRLTAAATRVSADPAVQTMTAMTVTRLLAATLPKTGIDFTVPARYKRHAEHAANILGNATPQPLRDLIEIFDQQLKILGSLSPDQRAVFVLLDIENLTEIEVVYTLGIDRRTVRDRVRRARTRISELLRDSEFGP